jgi:hypothetical protein
MYGVLFVILFCDLEGGCFYSLQAALKICSRAKAAGYLLWRLEAYEIAFLEFVYEIVLPAPFRICCNPTKAMSKHKFMYLQMANSILICLPVLPLLPMKRCALRVCVCNV